MWPAELGTLVAALYAYIIFLLLRLTSLAERHPGVVLHLCALTKRPRFTTASIWRTEHEAQELDVTITREDLYHLKAGSSIDDLQHRTLECT